jgi:hypothetical protein
LAWLALFALCCSDGRRSAEPPGTATSGERAGGATSDFTGDLEVCSAERQETPEDEPTLGFSMTELLAASVGQFDVPLRWQSRCRTHEAAAEACDAAAGFQALHNQGTIVHMSLLAMGPARVWHPTEQEPLCAQGMIIPGQLELSSDDGVLAAQLPVQLGSECGDQVSIDFWRPLGEMHGRLSDPSLGFPAGSEVEFTTGFFKDRMWFDLYVLTSEHEALFTVALPPYGKGWIPDVPRTKVELQPGTPLSASRCTSPDGVTY